MRPTLRSAIPGGGGAAHAAREDFSAFVNAGVPSMFFFRGRARAR
jgi:hypothetical protein